MVFITFTSIEDKLNLIKQIKQKSEWPFVATREYHAHIKLPG